MTKVQSDEEGLSLSGELTVHSIGALGPQIRQLVFEHPRPALRADLSGITQLDTSGAVFLRSLSGMARVVGKDLRLDGLPPRLKPFFDFVAAPARPAAETIPPQSALERLGDRVDRFYREVAAFFYLMADLTTFSIQSLYRRGGIRKGSFGDQAYAIGAQALQIVGLILFLIGAVSALQSAAQLRQFGADIFVANLLGIGLTRELGPLMTAIMVSGRSGSAIAAEIATMKFTEELDALQTMAIDPLRFVAVPKMWAMVLCVPLLTAMADFIGILGGTFVGVVSMDIPATIFLNQVFSSLFLKDILTGLIKSISFAWIITIIAVHRGLNFGGGASGVGQATTSSVVSSLFGIIVLDAFWGVIFYLRW
jgi:phospholipid/cholesterol/gamma-HCH transport system permease protein